METKTEKIVIDEEVCNYIESLQYDVNARQSIIAYMIANGFDTTSENFKSYQKEFCDCKIKYDTAKEELSRQYLIKGKWNFDFETRTLTYETV